MNIKCFMLEPTNNFKRNLRRFCFDDSPGARTPCQPKRCHNAVVYTQDIVEYPADYKWSGDGTKPFPHDDPRWPRVCELCRYTFVDGDQWQHNLERVWRRPETGEEFVQKDFPPGAMWFAIWQDFWLGPDGKALYVMLPDGHTWQVDGPASNSKLPWHRDGVPPIVTATPSILSPGYHGWLRNGELVLTNIPVKNVHSGTTPTAVGRVMMITSSGGLAI